MIGECNLTWGQARQYAEKGYWVAEQYFDSNQSLHIYEGKIYLEDGAMIMEHEIQNIEWFGEGHKFRVIAKPEDVDQEKLKKLHDIQNKEHLMLDYYDHSYQEAIIRKDN